MRSIPLEQLLLLAVVVLFPLFQLVRRWLEQRTRPPGPREPVRRVPPRVSPGQGMPVSRPVEPERPTARPQPPPQRAPQPRVEHAAPAFRVGGLAEARRAIVALVVFGPCRALEPPEPPGSRR